MAGKAKNAKKRSAKKRTDANTKDFYVRGFSPELLQLVDGKAALEGITRDEFLRECMEWLTSDAVALQEQYKKEREERLRKIGKESPDSTPPQ